MENVERKPACEQIDCPIKSSGKCLEGLEPENCTHFYWLAKDAESESEEKPDNSQDESGKVINLFSGLELGIKDLGLVTYQYPTNLVLIIGESDSGKTTILTSIFDMFQVGKFKQFYFAGSYTQYGFETRCHLSRASSELAEPETDKTTSIEFNFLHIAYKNIAELKNTARHLLLSDISGERFKMANNSASVMKEMELIKEADHLAYLLDGAKLADKLKRNSVITRARQFISRAFDNGLFSDTTNLTIIFTKGDPLDEIQNDGTLDKIKQVFIEGFEKQFLKLEFITIAARPKPAREGIPFGFGLEKLMEIWFEKKAAPVPDLTTTIASDRYFDLYALRNA